MALLHRAMEYYPYVFHPITALGVGMLLLVHQEWKRTAADHTSLLHRIGGFFGAGLLSLVPTAVFMFVTGSGPVETMEGNAWQVYALVASGLLVAAGTTWYLWRRFDWGPVVPVAMKALAAVAIPYIALSPIWNVSGHVIVALVPTLLLTIVNRRFWPLLAIPVVMVPNRIYLDAHTPAQSIGGSVIAAVVVWGVYRWHVDGRAVAVGEATAR